MISTSVLIDAKIQGDNFHAFVSSLIEGKWQQKFLSFYLKETPKQYTEVCYRIFMPALFREIF